jgi:DNA-directed RNA polymerase subunit omega
MGGEPLVSVDNDKPTVLALREIAEGKIGPEILNEVSAREHAMEAFVTEDEILQEI